MFFFLLILVEFADLANNDTCIGMFRVCGVFSASQQIIPILYLQELYIECSQFLQGHLIMRCWLDVRLHSVT